MKTHTGLAVFVCVFAPVAAFAQEWGTLSGMHSYREVFGLAARESAPAFRVTMLESNAPGNVFHEGEQPRFVFQIENLSRQPLQGRGRVDCIRYAQRGRVGDPWWPELHKLEQLPPAPLAVDLPPQGWKNLTVDLKIAETKGGYGLVVDLGPHGRAYLTSFVRTFKPALQRVQFPKQSLEEMPGPILARLGVQAIRWGVAYHPSSSRRADEYWAFVRRRLQEFHENMVTVLVEIGTAHQSQPLGRGRPHLDERGVMLGGKEDLVWLPECDDDYQQFVYRLAREFGWPKGPITALDLWNEPWEGLSISGWGADSLRYRELYKRLGDAVFQARKDAGVDLLVGGCDSSANTWDKLFPDGSDQFLPYLDFCSIHYQGLSSPVLYPEWNNRKHYKGRVLIWDTESWVANTDDRFAGVVAANRAAGYDRAMGTLSRIAVSTLSHDRIAYDTIKTADGNRRTERLIESRPLAAAYGAVQHLIGQREFREILFTNGLPWVFVFDGLQHNPDDGTVVVVGDVASLFQKGTPLFDSVRSLAEVADKQRLRDELAALAATDPRRTELRRRLRTNAPLTGASLISDCAGQPFHLYDVYGNAVPPERGRIVVPLNDKGFFLRADPHVPKSMAALLAALRQARVTGLEPLEMIAYDMTAPLARRPAVRLRLTSMHNQPVRGTLSAKLGALQLEYPRELSFAPREQKWVEVQVVGTPRADNTYPLTLRFDAGPHGVAVHEEDLHVNWIARRTIQVDGRLDDWRGVLPQIVRADDAAEPSFEEAMWLPFAQVKAAQTGGLAVGYLAHDDDCFYFAAKIADDTPHAGTVRFETRDEDADFYPAVSYSRVPDSSAGKRRRDAGAAAEPAERLVEHVWPAGVRRFSYRRWPLIPSSMPQQLFDNVLIGFNAIPLGEDGWLSHLPGRMPKFVWYKTTDYEYALNKVAEPHGGGTEIWRLLAPGMPYKHFFPRQPKHPQEGPVKNGRLAVRYEGGWRLVECALPWSEIPHVKQLRDAGRPVKFSFRVNHETRRPDLDLALGRSAAEGISHAFHPNWVRSGPNELAFGWEP
jgi:hypothetical protein